MALLVVKIVDIFPRSFIEIFAASRVKRRGVQKGLCVFDVIMTKDGKSYFINFSFQGLKNCELVTTGGV